MEAQKKTNHRLFRGSLISIRDTFISFSHFTFSSTYPKHILLRAVRIKKKFKKKLVSASCILAIFALSDCYAIYGFWRNNVTFTTGGRGHGGYVKIVLFLAAYLTHVRRILMGMAVLMKRIIQLVRRFSSQRDVSVRWAGGAVIVVHKYSFAFQMAHVDFFSTTCLFVYNLSAAAQIAAVEKFGPIRWFAFFYHRFQLWTKDERREYSK